MYLEYHIVVVLSYFFWFWQEIVFSATYVLSVQYSCAVVSVFLLWQESFITTRKKSSSRLSGGLCCCISFWFWREIGFGCTYYYVLGVPYNCGVVLVFLFWREIVFGVTYVLRPVLTAHTLFFSFFFAKTVVCTFCTCARSFG